MFVVFLVEFVDLFDCHGFFVEGVEDDAVVFCCLELFLGEEFEALWFVGDVVLVGWHGRVSVWLYLNVIGCQAVFINIFICQPLTLCDNGE